LAELEIVERSAHSMTVSYVDLAYDAAIAEGSKNFRFRNNTDMPILIEAYSEDRIISFRIWGHETRDENRTIKFENKMIKEIAPPSKEKITEDPTKPTSYKKVTQKAKYGYEAELYKIVYIDGVEVSRELVNKSNYKAEPAHVTIGTKGN
jgi:vancomycin resistance protein YoaR